MRRSLKWSAPLAALLALGAGSAQAQDFQASIAKAQTTLTNIEKLIDGIAARNKAAAVSSDSGAVRAVAVSGAKTYTVVLTGAACNGCAGALKKALESAGAKVVTAPARGGGQRNATIAVIELDSASLAKLKAAVAAADTPHKATSAPGLTLCAEGKVDGATNAQAIRQAIQDGKLKRVEL